MASLHKVPQTEVLRTVRFAWAVLLAASVCRAEDLSALQPVPAPNDPGPALILGLDSTPGGTPFVSFDAQLQGSGDCRVYFDYRDKLNFHYLDRSGGRATLGICEAGAEQILATGLLAAGEDALRLARHGAQLGLFQKGVLVVSAFDDRLVGGAAGVRMRVPGTPAVKLHADPYEEIRFNDDFMTVGDRMSQWHGNGSDERGEFKTEALKNAALSTNAFNYMGAGHNIYSVVGKPCWDNYLYQVSLRGPVRQCIGLVFAYQDDKNYGLFRWTARQSADPGKRELVRVRDGQEVVLAFAQGGYLPDQWYHADVQVNYARVSVAIDGHVLLEASDPALASGGAGVWCDTALPAVRLAEPKAQPFLENSLNELMKQHAVFDDVRIASAGGFEDSFAVPGSLQGGWLTTPDAWDAQRPDSAGSGWLTVAPGIRMAKALIGDRRWAQYQAQADVDPGTGSAGLVFLHRDESDYFAARVQGSVLQLARVSQGQETLADTAPCERSGAPVRLKATLKRGHVLVEAQVLKPDGTPSGPAARVEAFEGAGMLRGRAGLCAAALQGQPASVCKFRAFRLVFLPEPEALVNANPIFEGEMSMNDWANASREWSSPPAPVLINGRPVNMQQHTSQFPGDVEITVEPREFSDTKYDLALSVAREGQQNKTGYVFRYRVGNDAETRISAGSHPQPRGAAAAEAGPDNGARKVLVQIRRMGEIVAEKQLDDAKTLTSLAIRRCGKYIVGLADGRPLLVYRDENPLAGSGVAYYTQGVVLRTEAIRIVSDHFRNETFAEAPASWRTAGAAIAEVTNRWQCDPRWTFFSLKNDLRRGKPAVLWSKLLYPGDVTIEFYVSNKMETGRGQPYTYARDINVTLCSDGQDLTKGYTCLWGGNSNSGSMIQRDGVTVKSHPDKIPMTMDYHHHWFLVRVEKRGSQISFRVDRRFENRDQKTLDLVFEDTQPLRGSHIALWTCDNAVMISRVRISGAGGETADHPDWVPGALKTPYDGK